jgi:hypothetical protein
VWILLGDSEQEWEREANSPAVHKMCQCLQTGCWLHGSAAWADEFCGMKATVIGQQGNFHWHLSIWTNSAIRKCRAQMALPGKPDRRFGTVHESRGLHNYSTCCCCCHQQELDYLDGAVSQPKRPFCAIVGGSKVSSKITVIESLLNKVDVLIIG